MHAHIVCQGQNKNRENNHDSMWLHVWTGDSACLTDWLTDWSRLEVITSPWWWYLNRIVTWAHVLYRTWGCMAVEWDWIECAINLINFIITRQLTWPTAAHCYIGSHENFHILLLNANCSDTITIKLQYRLAATWCSGIPWWNNHNFRGPVVSINLFFFFLLQKEDGP